MVHMASRFYFYSMDGKEISTELSNFNFSYASASIAEQVDGKWKTKMYDTSKGKLFSRDEIEVFIDRKLNTREITINDFEGHDMVLVKHWCPNPDMTGWFILTSMKEGQDLACNVDLQN
jgi:hypothetical protein